MPDQNVGSPEKSYLFDDKHFRSLFQKWIHQAKKNCFNHTGCPKKRKWDGKKMEIMDMIKILVLRKTFFFAMLSTLGVFFQIWIHQANKSL